MARISFPGLAEYERKLSGLGKKSRGMCGKAIFEGAAIVADAIKHDIETLPERSGVTKKGLKEGFGISRLKEEDGFLNVKTGFSGYNAKGVPNQLMARVFEKGTSKVKRHKFVEPAVRRSRKQAEAAMAKVLDEEMKKAMK